MRSNSRILPKSAHRFASVEDLLHSSPWFAALDISAQTRVCEGVQQQDVPAGSALSRRGEVVHHWYGVLSGLLKWSVTTKDGQSIIFGGLSEGSWFGEGSMLISAPRPADVIALKSSRVAVMQRATFEWLYENELAFNHFLVQQINQRMFWYMESWAADRVLNAEGQVKRALVGLFQPRLYPHGSRHVLLSQEDVANLAGISRPRCNRALRRLQEAGLVKIEYGGLTVLDLDALRLSVSA